MSSSCVAAELGPSSPAASSHKYEHQVAASLHLSHAGLNGISKVCPTTNDTSRFSVQMDPFANNLAESRNDARHGRGTHAWAHACSKAKGRAHQTPHGRCTCATKNLFLRRPMTLMLTLRRPTRWHSSYSRLLHFVPQPSGRGISFSCSVVRTSKLVEWSGVEWSA